MAKASGKAVEFWDHVTDESVLRLEHCSKGQGCDLIYLWENTSLSG